jgi:hypothetical protein
MYFFACDINLPLSMICLLNSGSVPPTWSFFSLYYYYIVLLQIMVFNATFNNISVISWRSVLLMGETGVPGENHRTAASHPTNIIT